MEESGGEDDGGGKEDDDGEIDLVVRRDEEDWKEEDLEGSTSEAEADNDNSVAEGKE